MSRHVADRAPSMPAGEFELGTCMLCFNEVPKAQLLRVCGRKRCDAVACATCLDAWCASDSPTGAVDTYVTMSLARRHIP